MMTTMTPMRTRRSQWMKETTTPAARRAVGKTGATWRPRRRRMIEIEAATKKQEREGRAVGAGAVLPGGRRRGGTSSVRRRGETGTSPRARRNKRVTNMEEVLRRSEKMTGETARGIVVTPITRVLTRARRNTRAVTEH